MSILAKMYKILPNAPFLKVIACVCLGGALGALTRYFISRVISFDYFVFEMTKGVTVQNASQDTLSGFLSSFMHVFFLLFPIGILSVNVLGSFMLGAFLSYVKRVQEQEKSRRTPCHFKALHAFFVIGFLGSLTTFSTFTLDSIKLILPSLLNSALLQNVPLSEDFYGYFTMYDSQLSLYSLELINQHACFLGFSNIVINIVFCLCAVWLGGKCIHRNSISI